MLKKNFYLAAAILVCSAVTVAATEIYSKDVAVEISRAVWSDVRPIKTLKYGHIVRHDVKNCILQSNSDGEYRVMFDGYPYDVYSSNKSGYRYMFTTSEYTYYFN